MTDIPSAFTYYIVTDCPRCGGEIHRGPCMTLLEHNGYPVVSGDEIAETRVDCPHCATIIYYGELGYVTENGSGDTP